MKKKLLGLLLIVSMMLSIMPVTTFAEDNADISGTETVYNAVTESEQKQELTAVEKVQALIDALPDIDAITVENRTDVEEQLTTIDDEKILLTDEKRNLLDFTKYDSAINALNELDNMGGAEKPIVLESGTTNIYINPITVSEFGVTTAVYCNVYNGYNGGITEKSWGVKSTRCQKDSETGLYYIDIVEKFGQIVEGADYKIIIHTKDSNGKEHQTCEITFGIDCLGDTLTVTSEKIPHPDDSTKRANVAEWTKNSDKYGAEAYITSTGTIIGKYFPVNQPKEQIVAKYIADYAVVNATSDDGKVTTKKLESICKTLNVKQADVLEQYKKDYAKELADSTTYPNIANVETVEKLLGTYYTVTFNPNSGTLPEATSTTVTTDANGKLTSLPTPTRTGYDFLGWFSGETKWDLNRTITENMTLTAKWKDIVAPTGEIKLGTNSWKTVLNNITFGLFFKDAQEVEIIATDNSGEDVKIEYLLSDKGLSNDELANSTFTEYRGKFNIEPNNEYVIYAKLSDKTDNVTYINSNGIVLDNVVPVITGMEDGKNYCAAQTVTVTEKYADTVTVNGNSVTLDTNGQFTLSPAEVEQKIVVTDKAGNKTEITVTVNDGHTGGTADCTHKAVCTVCSEEYGEVNSVNHDFTEQVKSTDTLVSAATCQDKAVYYYTCSRCGVIEKNDTHTFEGELDSSNHAKTLGDWQSNESGHWKSYTCCPTVKSVEGKHTYEWKNENGQYWKKCNVCDHETDKKDIPEIAINGADKVCNGYDYTFTFTLPEGLNNPTAGYDCDLGSSLDVTDSGNGIYTVTVKADAYKNGYENGITNLEVIAAAETVEGYSISVSKQVEIISGHIGGTATCTEKAVCEICGDSYGALNSSNHVDPLKHTEAKSATTLAEGNIEYWHCENCGKYFSDKDANNEIQLSDTVVAKLSEKDDNKADDSKPSTDNKADNSKPSTDNKADNKKTTTENKSSDNKAVKTGDNSHMTAWITLLLASVGLLVVVGVYGRKKKDSKK